MKQPNCACVKPPFYHTGFESTHVGVDQAAGRQADVSIKRCRHCGRRWLHYQWEVEVFPDSGRWFRAPLADEDVQNVTPEAAAGLLAEAKFFLYGGAHFRSDGQWASHVQFEALFNAP